jgi:hypothetical protein
MGDTFNEFELKFLYLLSLPQLPSLTEGSFAVRKGGKSRFKSCIKNLLVFLLTEVVLFVFVFFIAILTKLLILLFTTFASYTHSHPTTTILHSLEMSNTNGSFCCCYYYYYLLLFLSFPCFVSLSLHELFWLAKPKDTT